jgi:hypothetical protein
MSRARTAAAVYNCAERHSGGSCPEPASVRAALVDRHVETIARAELERLVVTVAEGDAVKRATQRLAEAEAELRDLSEDVNLAGIDIATAADAARLRRYAVESPRRRCRPCPREHLPPGGTGPEVSEQLGPDERNAPLRSLLGPVMVKRAGGRGPGRPGGPRPRDRLRGADIRLPRRRYGQAMGIVPIELPASTLQVCSESRARESPVARAACSGATSWSAFRSGQRRSYPLRAPRRRDGRVGMHAAPASSTSASRAFGRRLPPAAGGAIRTRRLARALAHDELAHQGGLWNRRVSGALVQT